MVGKGLFKVQSVLPARVHSLNSNTSAKARHVATKCRIAAQSKQIPVLNMSKTGRGTIQGGLHRAWAPLYIYTYIYTHGFWFESSFLLLAIL